MDVSKLISGAIGGGGLYMAAGALALGLGVGFYKGHDIASTACVAARAEALQLSNDALVALANKTDEQLRVERVENTRINNLLDSETESANEMAADFQERIDGIRVDTTQVNPDCPPIVYIGLRELLLNSSRGSAPNPASSPSPDTP